MGSENPLVLAFIVGLAFGVYFFQRVRCASVTYDHRALVIDGKRRVLFSGSIHYPRTAPEVWPDIIRKSKEGGLDVIETYVFWNYHEPVRGQYFFEGRFDLVRFIKTVQEAGLLVHLRIGPYACAEWNYGGFPLWLHFIPGIQFRTTNAPFKQEMSRFLAKIVGLMKEEHLFASQGGPIILAQVENEYGNVEWAYGISGELYVQWAAHTALSLNTTVPWVMCQQSDAPDPIINTCNGFYCDQFTPNSKAKPKMWTECYTGWFLAFGYPIPYRPVEDLAFAVARFFETGGTFHNYYMYFGGTNFGRTAGGSLVATSYDYDAPIDEYGFLREPKWSHLRELHKAIKHCEEYLISSNPTHKQLGLTQEAHIYYKSSNDCAAFLANYDSKQDAHVTFRGKKYFLPAWSVSILPDCENVIFNTAKVVSQKHLDFGPSTRTTTTDKLMLKSSSWSWYNEEPGVWGNSSFTASGLLEQIRTTKDTSDFLWYTTSINKPKSGKAFLNIDSLGHAALVFVNKRMVGFGYGNHDSANFSINKIISLVEGDNSLDILSMMIGVQDYGPWFDVQGAGIFSANLVDFSKQKHELTSSSWTYQVGLKGEYLGLAGEGLANSSLWENGASPPINTTLIWYKATFMAPEGRFPLALDLSSMGKGQAWINGQSIGRYWPAYHSPSKGCTEHCDYRGSYDSQKCQRNCGQPTQTLYHVPRSWVHSGENLLVLHEELGGDPTEIAVVARTGQEICAFISENDPPPVNSWKPDSGFMSKTPEARLSCEKGWRITSVKFASFGSPEGTCGAFTTGACHADILPIVHKACLGQEECSVPVSTANIGNPCPGLPKTLAIEVVCS